MDDQGVGVGYVQPILDDGGGDENINAALHEGKHHLFQAIVRQLAMTHADARVRHQFADALGDGHDAVHAVVNHVNLAATPHLELDGAGDQLIAPGRHHRLDGEAVFRRGFDQGNLTKPRQTHVQRARNGRSA